MPQTLERPSLLVDRELDAARINAVLNHPAVRPWVAGAEDGVLDATGALRRDSTYLLMGEFGGCMFCALQPGVYEVHTQVLPTGRGDWTRQMTKDAVHWLFTRTDCYEIVTRVPRGHIGAKAATMQVGMKYEFTAEKCLFRGKSVEMDVYGFRIQDWARDAVYLGDFGQKFHVFLESEAARLGITEPIHENYEAHNQYLGAGLEMFLSGNTKKAVAFYNRWASVARHRVVSYLDDNNIGFDIGVLRRDAQALEVVQC